jgi:DNA-binding transcriptional LysR family regulator
MNIRQLKQFIAIAESGNMSRSAKERNISQPALTRSMQNLEDHFGVELIVRKANGVFLTAYGEHLLNYARSIVNDADRAKKEITAMHQGERGTLSIGVGPVFSAGFLTATLDRLLAQGPNIEVRLVEGFVEDLCADLRSGKLDAVLSLFPTDYDIADLSFTGLCEVKSVIAASPKHSLNNIKNVNRAQLASSNWVIPDQKCVRNMYRQFFGNTDTQTSVHHIRANSMRLIKNLVQESDYLTILPRILIENELCEGSMTVIDGPMQSWVSVGGIASRPTGTSATVLSDFIDIIKDEFNFNRDRLVFAQANLVTSA